VTELRTLPPAQEASAQVSELFEEPPPLIARGLVYLLLALAAALLGYSAIGRVDEVVTAPAVVVPEGFVRRLEAVSGGRVTRVAVREGEQVRAGQALVYLETEAAQEQLRRSTGEQAMRRLQLEEQLAANAGAGPVAEARARLAQAEADLQAARRGLQASILTAPADGQVTRLAVHGPGETVQAGQEVADLAPAGAAPVFEARVPSSHIGQVRPGQDVKVKVEAFPHQEFGALPAVVRFVAPDAQPDPNGALAYRVLLAPVREPGSRSGEIRLRLGLTATAEIVTRRPRILDLFLHRVRGQRQ
jgi:multidrug efflux pump subunit AcrA (membrane-fusion protein)